MASLLASYWEIFILLPIITMIMGWTLRFPLYKVARCKQLSDRPNARSSHRGDIPYVGGVLIFSVFCSSLLLFEPSVFLKWRWACLGLFLMFALGLYDDILKISPMKKIKGELFAIILVVVCQKIQFTDLGGFLGLHEMPLFVSILITVLFLMLLVNALNLLDGIDGLCAGVAMSDALFLGYLFVTMHRMDMTVVCMALFASLLPFFIINVFGKRIKMFLGDTGSLTLGLLLGTLAVVCSSQAPTNGSIAMAMSIFSLPIFDALRLFVFRLWNHRSPFAPDKNHIHHKILQLVGNHHLKATLSLLVLNAFFLFWTFWTQDWNMEWVLFSSFGWFVLIFTGVEWRVRREMSRRLQTVESSCVIIKKPSLKEERH